MSDLRSGEILRGDVAVLAAQVACLARLLLGGIADGHFAALVRVKMGARTSAVAVCWDRLFVDMVHCELSVTRPKKCKKDYV